MSNTSACFWLTDWADCMESRRMWTCGYSSSLMFSVYAGRHIVAREEITLSQDFPPPLQRIFILNQKAHYSTHRLTCPLYPAEMWYGHIQKLMQLLTSKTKKKKMASTHFHQLYNLEHLLPFCVVFSSIWFPRHSKSNGMRATDDNEASLFWPAALMAIVCSS